MTNPAAGADGAGGTSAAAAAGEPAGTDGCHPFGIWLRRLTAGYPGLPVVHDLSLQVAPAEVVALLGPNGAGKTTTLLTVSGLLPPIGGEVWVLGRRVRGKPHRVARLGLAQVPADRSLFTQLTGAENLRLANGDRAARDAALDYFPELRGLLHRRAGLLSGGEQQMLALARALATRPKMLMVDELSLGLAPLIVSRLLGVLPRFAADTGAGVLVVEQHVELALQVAARAYLLQKGRLVYQGTAAQLRARPDLLRDAYLGTVTS